MKKFGIVFMILTIVFFISPVIAQNHLIGPLVGLNFASVDVDHKDEEGDTDTSTRTGFIFGGSFYLALSSNIGLQFEPAYIQKGSKAVEKGRGNEEIIKVDLTLKANYIDIPLLFKASFGQASTKPYLLAGVNLALKTGDPKIEVDKVTINGQDVTSQIPIEEFEEEIQIQTKGTDFGFNFGAGILIPIGSNQFFIEGLYNIGLQNILDEDSDESDVKNKGLQIKAGIFFPLSR